MESDALREAVLAAVRAEGFELAGIAPATAVPAVREAANDALAAGRLAGMGWMDPAWLERATDPDRFLPGARSIIVVALPNHSPEPEPGPAAGARGRVARYARGRDYHRVFEKRLRRIARWLREEFGTDARATVDYGPLLERPYAELAGLAWRGRSTMALLPGFGPWVMLGVVATTLDLPADQPIRKSCGSCARCITACPTGAIAPDGGVVDARRCISYHTIENRGAIPRELRPLFGDWVFGCDACLDACPVGQSRFESYAEFEPTGPDEARRSPCHRRRRFPCTRHWPAYSRSLKRRSSNGSVAGRSCGRSGTASPATPASHSGTLAQLTTFPRWPGRCTMLRRWFAVMPHGPSVTSRTAAPRGQGPAPCLKGRWQRNTIVLSARRSASRSKTSRTKAHDDRSPSSRTAPH
ncbi:MAG TPA: tRNA epoxyqueuosine(34) reductase QueG [Tepidiformaceae bacterium]|nr:tRNA epoxyqueuosine(34) reductase QueG [Tepidiformaceae bacterium]